MSISFVAAGAITTVASSSAAVTPAFGQATTAGNLLLALLPAAGSGNWSWSTSSAGWTIVGQRGANTNAFNAIGYKYNCGAGETAPTFTPSVAVSGMVMLAEFSGAVTASSPLDQVPTAGASSSNPAPDTFTDDLIVQGVYVTNSKSATCTFSATWTPGTGTVTTRDNGATKTTAWGWFGFNVLAVGQGGGVADSCPVTPTPSTGTATFTASGTASFMALQPAVVVGRPRTAGPMSQAIKRASYWRIATELPWKRKTTGGLVVPDLAVF